MTRLSRVNINTKIFAPKPLKFYKRNHFISIEILQSDYVFLYEVVGLHTLFMNKTFAYEFFDFHFMHEISIKRDNKLPFNLNEHFELP